MCTHFTADIDAQSVEYAERNVQQNNLTERIRVARVDPSGPILPSATFDFTMCNPPFYGSREEVLQSAEAKELGPSAVCTGTDNEMITPGGEVAFVRLTVEESLVLGTRCL